MRNIFSIREPSCAPLESRSSDHWIMIPAPGKVQQTGPILRLEATWHQLSFSKPVIICLPPKDKMESDLPRLSKRGQRNLSVSCLASWAAFDYTGRDWLNWLLRWLPSFSYQSAIKKKKITSWFNGPGLLSAPSRQKPCTFPGIREEPTSGQSAAWRSHCAAR